MKPVTGRLQLNDLSVNIETRLYARFSALFRPFLKKVNAGTARL